MRNTGGQHEQGARRWELSKFLDSMLVFRAWTENPPCAFDILVYSGQRVHVLQQYCSGIQVLMIPKVNIHSFSFSSYDSLSTERLLKDESHETTP